MELKKNKSEIHFKEILKKKSAQGADEYSRNANNARQELPLCRGFIFLMCVFTWFLDREHITWKQI